MPNLVKIQINRKIHINEQMKEKNEWIKYN